MTIHADFWRDRNRVRVNLGGRLSTRRDSLRQRCYNWENKHLRPVSKTFDRQAAKGYARLCVKIAIRHMRELGLITSDEVADMVRGSFQMAFTKERIGHCNANNTGAYFAAWGWTDVIIAHEIAHWADQWAHKLTTANPFALVPYEPHGPKWRGWFAYLLANAGLKAMPDLLDPYAFILRTLREERLAVIETTAQKV